MMMLQDTRQETGISPFAGVEGSTCMTMVNVQEI
jgi:hypothetical protein